MEVRTSKRSFEMQGVIDIAREITASELGKPTAQPLQEINALLSQLAQDTATTLTAALEPDHVVQRMSFRSCRLRFAHAVESSQLRRSLDRSR